MPFLCLINIVEKPQTSLTGQLALWLERQTPEAKFIVPDWGYSQLNSDIGLLYRPASLCSLAGRYDNPMWLCRSWLYPPVKNYEFGYGSWGLEFKSPVWTVSALIEDGKTWCIYFKNILMCTVINLSHMRCALFLTFSPYTALLIRCEKCAYYSRFCTSYRTYL